MSKKSSTKGKSFILFLTFFAVFSSVFVPSVSQDMFADEEMYSFDS
jgi:hypothetical protein